MFIVQLDIQPFILILYVRACQSRLLVTLKEDKSISCLEKPICGVQAVKHDVQSYKIIS